ncbi:MAG TPA: hypothetical protein VNK91_06485 [Burkholderiaceae bacterium]|nr:hypothetical protein [Burkholderiaceae bacterium]
MLEIELVRAGVESLIGLLVAGATAASAFKKPDTSAADAAAEMARRDAEEARAERKRAQEAAEAAAAGDTELQRRAAERRLRTLLSEGGFAQFATQPMAAPAVNYRTAFGS